MKIICQACQSKYTIADDKIQGKVAKIRCRQCGATVLIDGSTAGGAQAEGSAEPSTLPTAEAPWLVNVADGDQRSMSVQQVVEAYNAHEITTETYVWKDGFSDWKPIGQIHEIIDELTKSLRAATPAAAAPQAGGYQAPTEAARKEAPRGGGGDLFKPGAKDDAVVASPPAQQAAPAGAAGAKGAAGEESSNIFSLGALTSGAEAPFVPLSPSVKGKEDSGVIDLNALAKAQAAAAEQAAAAPKPAPPQFLFPAALGQVQQPAPIFDIPEPPKRSSMPKVVAIGVVIAVGLVGVLLFATHKEEPAPPPVASVAPAPEPTPAPTASEAPPAESAAPVASAAPTKKAGRGGGRVVTKKSTGSDVSVPTVPAAGPKRGACGCAPGDMQCNIRCSATGK